MAAKGKGAKKSAAEETERKRGGRKYATAEELQAKCDEYFNSCDAKGILYGEAGLALALGVTLTSLRRWYDGGECADLQETVQMAYLRIQNQLESGFTYQEKGMVTKAIFMLKQSRLGGYQDKIESKTDIAVNVKLGDGMDASDFK